MIGLIFSINQIALMESQLFAVTMAHQSSVSDTVLTLKVVTIISEMDALACHKLCPYLILQSVSLMQLELVLGFMLLV